MAPIVVNAMARGVWAPDEPRYAEVAREAFDSHSLSILHLCGELYPDKPPLFFWAIGSLGELSHWNVPLMRLVSVASIVALAVITSAFARRWWGEDEARWAPLLFLGMVLVVDLGGRLQIDPLLAALCCGALLVASDPSENVRGARFRMLAAGALTGLGALAKGPIAFVIVGLVLLVWQARSTRTKHIRAGWAAVVAACLLALAPVATWAVLASLQEPALWRPLFFGQHIERAVKGTAHKGPPWKHLIEMPLLLLPWTAPVVLGLSAAWRSWRACRAGRNSMVDPGLFRAGAWLLALFLFFSIIPAKRELYLLPAYPAAALLASRWLVLMLRAGRIPAWVAWSSTCLLPVLGVGSGLGGWIASRSQEQLHSLLGIGLIAGIALLVLTIPSALALLAGDQFKWARRFAVSWALGVAVGGVLVLPVLDRVKSPQHLARAISQLPQRPTRIPCYGKHPEGLRYYSGLPFVAGPVLNARGIDVSAIRAQEGESFLAVFRESDWELLPTASKQRMRVLLRAPLGSETTLVVGAAEPVK